MVQINSGGGGSYTFSTTAPSTPAVDDRWTDADDGITYQYVNDGTSSQWVELGPVGISQATSFQAGSVTGPGITVGSGTTYSPGLYSPSTDVLAVSTGGVQRVKFDSTGLTLPGSTSGNITLAATAVAGTTTLTLPATTGTVVTTGDTGTVTGTMIAAGTIVDAGISASAAIATSKLANFTAGQVLLGNASGVPTATTMSGDITVNSSGVTAISSGVIADADINASAAIAGTKISPNFGSQNVSTTGTVSGALRPSAGTASVAAVLMTSGANLTSAAAGAIEYDGAAAYFTPDTTIGRGYLPATQTFRLTSAGSAIGNTITNFFGTNSNIPLVANAFYEIDIYMLALRGTTAGPATITLTNSAAPTLMLVDYEASPLAGVAAPPGSVTALTNLYFRGTTTTTTAAYAITTGTLAISVNHYFRLKLFLQNGTGTSLKIQMTAGTANNSMTPQAGSVWFCRRLPGANTGTFAA